MLLRALKLGDPVAALKELPEKAEEQANRPTQKMSTLWGVKMKGREKPGSPPPPHPARMLLG